jgi:hypothetical protein
LRRDRPTVPRRARSILEAAGAAGVPVGCAPDAVLGTGIQTARKAVDDGEVMLRLDPGEGWIRTARPVNARPQARTRCSRTLPSVDLGVEWDPFRFRRRKCDALVARRSDNATLASMLTAVSSRTIRARAWRGVADESASSRTVTQHREILEALTARDPHRAEAAALLHVATTESWFRRAQEDE